MKLNQLKKQIKILEQKVKGYKSIADDPNNTHAIMPEIKFARLCAEVAVYRTAEGTDHFDEKNLFFEVNNNLSKETEEIVYKSMGKNNKFLGSSQITNYNYKHLESEKLIDLRKDLAKEIQKTREESEKLYRKLKNKIEDKIYTLIDKAKFIETKESWNTHYDKISGKETKFFKIQKERGTK